MRLFMGLRKNQHGVFVARKKVPKALEEAVARALGNGKERQSWLQRSLGTKDAIEANRLAKPVLMEFDRTLERAKELIAERPVRSELNETEIRRMAEYHYASVLAEDDKERLAGLTALSDEARADLSDRLGRDLHSEEDIGVLELLHLAREANAGSDVGHVRADVERVLEDFCTRLDPASRSYRALSIAILKEQVRAYEALWQRVQGKAVSTPRIAKPPSSTSGRCSRGQSWDDGQ